MKNLFKICALLLLSTSLFASENYYYNVSYNDINNKIKEQFHSEIYSLYSKDNHEINCSEKNNNTQTPSGYKCGEIPLGDLYKKNKKKIFDFTLNKGNLYHTKDTGVYLKKNVNLKLLLNRKQYQSKEKIRLIDKRKLTNVQLSDRIDKNLFIKHYPRGQKLFSEVCYYAPGLNIEIPSEPLHFYAYKKVKVLFWTLKGEAYMSSRIAPGKMRTKNEKVCALFSTSADINVESPEKSRIIPKLIKVGFPEVRSLKMEGLQVYGTKVSYKPWWAKVIVRVLKFFGIIDITKMIKNELETQIQSQIDNRIKISMKDLRSGKLFKKYLESALGKGVLTKKFLKSVRNALKDVTPTDKMYQKDFENSCFEIFKQIENQHNIVFDENILNTNCKGLALNIKVTPFYKRKLYAERGCYDKNYSSVLDYTTVDRHDKNLDWKHQCALSAQYSVEGLDELKGTRKCIFEGLINGDSQSQITAHCSEKALQELFSVEDLNTLYQMLESSNPTDFLIDRGFSNEDAEIITSIFSTAHI